MLVRKTKEQKEYLLKLKSEISDFLINYKKRYQLFPWIQVNKVSKLQINSNSPIKVNGVDFTVKKLVKEINQTKTKLQSKLRPFYYNYILKAYIKDSMNKDGKQLKDIYRQYHEELQNVFKEMQTDLLFCLEGLKQMNRALKPEKQKIEIKESTEIDNTVLESLCKKITNQSYNFIKDFLSRTDIKEKYKKWYDSDDVDVNDMEKSLMYYSIDCGISQDASLSSGIFDELLKELNKHLDEIYHDEISKYKIAWDDKNSGFIWLTLNSKSADKVLQESVVIESSSRETILNKTLEVLKANGRCPKVTPREQQKWIEGEQTSQFGNSLCIAGLGNEGLSSVCTKVNAEIKSYGGHLSPDNYGTAFLTIKESEDLFEENVMMNRNDLYYNLEKFEKGETNVLLITGFSGSGKSTLATELSNKYKCEYFELDALDFFLSGNLSKEDMEKGEPGLLAFINKHKELQPKEIPNNKEYDKLYSVYIQFLVNWCKKQKDKKFIIEGLQIYETFNEKEPQPYIRSNSLIIKGTSGLVSALRASKRNSKDNSQTTFFKELNSLVKWVIKDEKHLSNLYKYVKESEDKTMFDITEKEVKESAEFNETMTFKFVNENGELEDVRDFMLSLYESIDLDDDDEEIEEVTEGTNLKSRRIYKDMKKQVKDLTNKYKKAMKQEKYDVAKRCLADIKKVVAQSEKDIRDLESTSGSIVFGKIAEYLLAITRYIYVLIPIAGPFMTYFKNKKYNLDKLAQVEDNIKKSDDVTADAYNEYKNYLLIHINTIKEDIKKLEGIVANEEKIAKRVAADKAKKEKEVKESAEFKAEKLAIYEACNRGEITVEEREELFQNLKDNYYLSEAATDDETLTEESGLSNKEKFEKVRSVLYERCSKGELTVEERENLIMKAKEKIFTETETSSKEEVIDNTEVVDKANKELDKELDNAVK